MAILNLNLFPSGRHDFGQQKNSEPVVEIGSWATIYQNIILE